MKSVSRFIFRSAITLLALLAGCTSAARRNSESTHNIPARPIFNIRLLDRVGPVLSDGTSLIEPAGAAFSKLGEIFISDQATNAIYRLSPELKVLAREGGIGNSLGGFNRPVGLAFDAALNLYVADSGNRRIQILDKNLRYARIVDTYFGENREPLEFSQPEDIAIDSEGNLWIADNDKVIKLNAFFELQLELSYNAPGGFRIGRVTSIDISNSDLVAICDRGNQSLIISSIYGNMISEFHTGTPSCVAWDQDDNIWVSDQLSGKISAYDIHGNLRFAYSENIPGSSPGWLAFDLLGRLIVLDTGLRRLVLYEVIRGPGDSDEEK